MYSFTSLCLLALSFAVHDVTSSPAQIPFQLESTKPRKLHGRFLHITDMHPDPHYIPHTSQSTACHRKKPKKKKNESHYYGTPYSECDSPLRLTNHTLDFLKDNWANEIDFVIWTGDNARHDNDRQVPRTPSEINMLNRAVAEKMHKVFSSKGIPVVPSLGNNDVWPHNILTPGPNTITNGFASIWSQFIPFPYLQVFQRGAYYTVEVIPDEVAVVSLNTMYFYDSNKVVSGCPYQEPSDPGNLQIDWLEVQLDMYRKRGMQVWISGHVPPSTDNYFPECYVRYLDLALRYQGTILGHLFGHMNVDHFFLLQAEDLEMVPDTKESRDKKAKTKKPSLMQHDGGLYDSLLEEFSSLPQSPKLTDYAVVNVAPSVVPNPYLPTFRIFAYNVTDAEDPSMQKELRRKRGGHRHGGGGGNKTVNCKTPEHQETWRCHLGEPWYSDPASPSRKNQRWSPIGYAQYYMPDLKRANKTHAPSFELEYLTYDLDVLHPGQDHDAVKEFAYPVPVRHLPEVLREPGLDKSKYAPYRMKDLTIPSWIRLARLLADDKRQKLRKRFRKYMYLGGKEE